MKTTSGQSCGHDVDICSSAALNDRRDPFFPQSDGTFTLLNVAGKHSRDDLEYRRH